jgi:hypothetical protein
MVETLLPSSILLFQTRHSHINFKSQAENIKIILSEGDVSGEVTLPPTRLGREGGVNGHL